MSVKKEALKEKRRMQQVFSKIVIKKNKKKTKADSFYQMAKNYYEDGLYFFEKKKFIQAFEAFIISWTYIDAGIKINFFTIPKSQKKWFTA